MLVPNSAVSDILFEDSFDAAGYPDWTLQQSTTSWSYCNGEPCSPDNPPGQWDGWLMGKSWCNGGPGYNSMYINASPGYPAVTTGKDRSGNGKAITFWDESCSDHFEDSDAQLSATFPGSEEIYIEFSIKFSPNYRWSDKSIDPYGLYMHKILHVQYWDGNVSSFDTGIPENFPMIVPGFMVDQDEGWPRLWYYALYQCENDPYCAGYDYTHSVDQAVIGNFYDTVGDGNWHTFKFYFKMNSYSGGSFKADGVHTFWVDGVRVFHTDRIPYSTNGSSVSPRRLINYVSLGGNVYNRWTKNCSGTGCEQWYAIDDFVIYKPSGISGGIPRTFPQNLRFNPDATN